MSSIQNKSPVFYCGFDPTAKSLHLGHMTVISVMLYLLKHGHRVIALVSILLILVVVYYVILCKLYTILLFLSEFMLCIMI